MRGAGAGEARAQSDRGKSKEGGTEKESFTRGEGREQIMEPGNEATARGFEPLRAEPNGFRVHFLSRSDTLSAGNSEPDIA